MRSRSVLLIGAVGVVALAGCSTSTSAPSSSPTTSAPAPTSPTATSTPTDVLPPIIVDGTKKAMKATVGDTLDITVPNVKKVSTDNAEILKVTQAHDDGSAEYNAGAEVLAPGKAVLTIETADSAVEVTVNVTG